MSSFVLVALVLERLDLFPLVACICCDRGACRQFGHVLPATRGQRLISCDWRETAEFSAGMTIATNAYKKDPEDSGARGPNFASTRLQRMYVNI